MAFKDKALVGTSNLELTTGGDIATVEDAEAELQAAQNRCVAHLGSWVHDLTFGSQLHLTLRENGPYQVTNETARAYIESALRPMLDEGRLTSLEDVKIVQRNSDSIWIEITVKIGVRTGEILFPIPA